MLIHKLALQFIKYYPFDYYPKRTIIGLAAGFDKNCDLLSYIHKLGFAFAEVGSLTPKENKGNKYSRIIKTDHSIINNLGLPNIGIDKAIPKLKAARPKIPILVNISALYYDTFQDVQDSVFKVQPYCAAIVLNLHCPNISHGIYPADLIKIKSSKDIFLKLGPDLTKSELSQIVTEAIDYGVKGYVLTNSMPTPGGGLSGRRLKDFSNASIALVNKLKSEDQIIIGCGGIETTEDVLEKIDLGATCVELLSSWILSKSPLYINNLNNDINNKTAELNN